MTCFKTRFISFSSLDQCRLHDYDQGIDYLSSKNVNRMIASRSVTNLILICLMLMIGMNDISAAGFAVLERIRIDCESAANHTLIQLLNKPGEDRKRLL